MKYCCFGRKPGKQSFALLQSLRRFFFSNIVKSFKVTNSAVSWFFNLFVCFDCRQVSSNDYSSLDTLTKNIVKEKQPFVRLELSKEDLLEMFKVTLKVQFRFVHIV